MSKPLTKDLRSYSDQWLIGLLIRDTSNAVHYRDEISRQVTQGNTFYNQFWNEQNKYRNGEGQASAPWPKTEAVATIVEAALSRPDIRPYYDEADFKVNGLAQAIKGSSWDRIDPSGRMTTTPQEVDEFLDNISFRPQFYSQLHEKAQNLLNTIVDAYGRWWRLSTKND